MSVLSRNLGLAFILLACHSLAFSQIDNSQIQPITSALSARDYDKAVELSRTALQKSPNNPELWTLEGIALV
ncbi:MAG: hypothetical protein WBE97_01820, partial [Candidatus Acidiferrales bacterium]